MVGKRTGTALFAAALALRVGFVLWAPGEPQADGIFYHAYAQHIEQGRGYIDMDGSPVVRWMPGWPLVLAGLYGLFGPSPLVAVLANACFDAATALLLAVLGARLFDRRVGIAAGILYTCWPGQIFLCATLMSEPLFGLLLVGTLLLADIACAAESKRLVRFGLVGLGLGAAALVKAEPLVMLPALLLAFHRSRRSQAELLGAAAATLLVTAAVLTPWTVRNWLHFDRFLPTAASGGIGVQLANHPGATGGQDLRANMALQHRYRRDSAAATSIARNDVGWKQAWTFARSHPREELRIIQNKLRLTYTSDDRGAALVRGVGPESTWHLSAKAWHRMRWIANTYWFMALALALAGLGTLRSWKPRTAPLLLLGVLLPWLGLHVVFLGGPRYHVPQVPALALLAACGANALAITIRRRHRARSAPKP